MMEGSGGPDSQEIYPKQDGRDTCEKLTVDTLGERE